MAELYFPEHIYKKLEDSVKPETVKRYYFWLRKVMPTYSSGQLQQLHRTKEEEIRKRPDATSLLAAIIKLLKIEGVQEGDKIMNQTEKLLNDIRGSKMDVIAQPKQKDLDNELTVESIMALRNKKEEEFNKKPSLRLGLQLQVLYLYTEIPPLRSQDYINTSFDKNESINYIDLDRKELIIREGKTTNKANSRIIDIPDKAVDIIKKVKELSQSKWLIPKVQTPSEHMKNDTFAKFLNTIFGKSVSSSRLRNIFVSSYNDANMSIEDRKKNANIMGHQVSTSQAIYTKFSKKLHDKDKYIDKLEAENKALKKRIKELEAMLNK